MTPTQKGKAERRPKEVRMLLDIPHIERLTQLKVGSMSKENETFIEATSLGIIIIDGQANSLAIDIFHKRNGKIELGIREHKNGRYRFIRRIEIQP